MNRSGLISPCTLASVSCLPFPLFSPVWITRQPESIDCYIGDRASLICSAEGCQPDQKITYMWLRSVTRGDRKKHSLTCNSGVLPFDRLSQKDWGYYVCQAQNNYQHVQSEEVFVKVSAPPADGSRARGMRRQRRASCFRSASHLCFLVCPQIVLVRRSASRSSHGPRWFRSGDGFVSSVKPTLLQTSRCATSGISTGRHRTRRQTAS